MTRTQRLKAWLLWRIVGLIQRLPHRFVHRVAALSGYGLYLVQARRRALVRANLGRVCAWLVANDLASSRVAAAARDPRRLDRLVRDAFAHYVRSYAEAALVPAYDQEDVLARVRVETPEAAAEVLGAAAAGQEGGAGTGRIAIGLHFGAVELGARYLALLGSAAAVGPMETIADPALETVILRSRSGTGMRLVPLDGAGAELSAALRRGETVAIVADRTIRGPGAAVTLFGAPARLPVGPAALAVASGAPAYVMSVRRTGLGSYAGSALRVPPPGDGSRRERIRQFLDAQARLFERVVAAAPEQWWTLFFPIWDDVRPAP